MKLGQDSRLSHFSLLQVDRVFVLSFTSHMKKGAQVTESYLSRDKLLASCLAPKEAQHLAMHRQLARAPLLSNILPKGSLLSLGEWLKFSGLGYQSLGLKPG